MLWLPSFGRDIGLASEAVKLAFAGVDPSDVLSATHSQL